VDKTALMFFAVWALCLALLLSRGRGGLYRPSASYLVLFGLFHGGLLLSIWLRGPDGYVAYDISWIYDGYTSEAVNLAILGMVAFTIATELAARGARPGPPIPAAEDRLRARWWMGGIPGQGESHTRRPEVARVGQQTLRLTIVGLSCLFFGLVIFAVAVANAGGLSLLSGGYLNFIQANESDSTLGYGTLLIGLGTVLSVIAGGRVRLTAWATFGTYAIVAFLIGSRGAVLFALLALLVVEVRQGHRIRPLWTVGGAVLVLVLIGLVRQTRLTGFAGSGRSSVGSPLDALAEMGYSLRPTTTVLGWHSAGEPFREGVTLIAVPLRFLERLTGWHGGPPAFDDRLFNAEISDRVGPIGGSPIAEGYHNFGVLGVVLLMAVIGFVLGRLERLPCTAWGTAVVGAVLLPMLVQVRNSFAPVPVQLALGLLLAWVATAGTVRRGAPVETSLR
jgi:O-antigen polysaccharide polymerase Wzy